MNTSSMLAKELTDFILNANDQIILLEHLCTRYCLRWIF